MPIGNMDAPLTADQQSFLQAGQQRVQDNLAKTGTMNGQTAAQNLAAVNPTPSIASQVTPNSTPATGTTGTTASTGGSPPISTQLNQAATNPQMQQISSQWKPNPTNDPAIAASNNALHQQNLQTASQNGLVYDQNTGTYSQAPTQQDGSLHLNVNGKAGSDIPVYQGHSFAPAADFAKQLGLDFKQDPKTGEVTIGGVKVNPISYTKGMPNISTRQLANALGLTVGYDDKTKTITITGKDAPKTNDVVAAASTGGPQYNGYNSPIQAIAQGMPQMQPMTPWQQPDLSGFQQNMMPYQQFNPNMTNFYDQAHAQLDPQFNANNQKLMDKQALDINNTDESLNRKNIYSSGIAIAAENDLKAKTTNALAQGFTAQMAQIEKTAQTLYNTAYKQYQDGNAFALKNNQDQVTNMLNTEKQSFSEWAQTQKLDQSQYNYALKAWDDMASKIMTDAENQTKANQFQQTQSFDQYKFNNPSAAQQLPYQYQTANNAANNATSAANNAANNQTKTDIALLPYQSMTQYQQATTQEKQQMDAAVNYFKQQGINIDQAKLMESIRHNQAGEANAAANTQMNAYKLAGYLPNGKPTFDREKFIQTKQHDSDLVEIARTNATNSENKTEIDGIGKELSSISSQINDIYNNPTTDTKQQAANTAMVDKLSGQRDQYINQLKQYTDQGFVNPPTQ